MTERRAVLSLGGNVGNVIAQFRSALAGLAAADGVRVTAVSPVYATDPVGELDQPEFLNLIVLVDTLLDGRQLLALIRELEVEAGRVRRRRWGPRTLDIDIIALGDEVSPDADLTLPHPRAHERAFVLVPWLAVDGAARLPGHGSVADLVARVGTGGVRLVGELADQRTLEPPE